MRDPLDYAGIYTPHGGLFMFGELPSPYDKKKLCRSKSARYKSMALTREQDNWMLKWVTSGKMPDLKRVARESLLGRHTCVGMTFQVYRKRKIRDRKNLLWSLDRLLIDPLVRNDILPDDDDEVIWWNAAQLQDRRQGILVSFGTTTIPCRSSAVEKARQLYG